MATELICALQVNQKVPHTQNEKEANILFISSVMKQVLKTPQKYLQTNAANVYYYPVSHRDSDISTEQRGNLEWHDVSKIEDRAQCQISFKYQ